MATVSLTFGIMMAALRASAQEEPPKPTPAHELLKQSEGTWEATTKIWMEPGKDPSVSKGTMTATVTCGGLWLVFDYTSEFMGAPFTGHGVQGYDVQKKKYVSTWVDSWTTAFSQGEGSYDEKTKTMTMTGEDVDAKTGKKMKRKEVTEVLDKNTHRITFSYEGEGGKDVVVMVIDFKRKK